MEVDKTNVPYLRLPHPHHNIILATSRNNDTDNAALISMLNHPEVYMNLAGPPYPYTKEHHDEKLKKIHMDTEQFLSELRDVQENRRCWVGGSPFKVIREIDPQTLEETIVGDFVVRRSDFLFVNNKEDRARMKAQNDRLEAGDAETVWEIGFSLIPTFHGRGIMTSVIRTLTQQWLIPYMNVHHLTASYLEHNVASRRVFEKNGWSFVKFEPEYVELPEAVTGVQRKKFGMGVMKWDRV